MHITIIFDAGVDTLRFLNGKLVSCLMIHIQYYLKNVTHKEQQKIL